jgi:hypothetical protein
MRSFLIVWLLAFALIAAGSSAVSWFVSTRAPDPPPASAARRQEISFESDPTTSGPFSETEAIEIVARRLPTSSSADAVRRDLKTSATVTYHSAQHWRICVDGACWVAHGPGRYAEPENDAALKIEGPLGTHPVPTTPQ